MTTAADVLDKFLDYQHFKKQLAKLPAMDKEPLEGHLLKLLLQWQNAVLQYRESIKSLRSPAIKKIKR